MNRAYFQLLSRARLRESRTLLRAGCFDGAYYLAGLAVECALKACIARQTKRYDFPDKKVVMDSHSHDLEQLLRTAGLSSAFDAASDAEPKLADNWAVVKDWDVASRYTLGAARRAQDLYAAVTARRNGVLTWIRSHW